MTAVLSPPLSTSQTAIVSSRHFSVRRSQLVGAFTDPEQLARWWGPKGFSNTFHEFDLRVDGRWRFTMRGPDGVEYSNVKEFTRVDTPALISFRHQAPVHSFQMELTFEEEGDGSRMTWRMQFDSKEEQENLKDFILAANEENFDRLQDHLESWTATDEVVIRRRIKASPTDLFKAWTNPETLAQWWGPHAFTNSYCALEARVGGEYQITMRSPDGVDYPMRGKHLEFDPPHRLCRTMDCSQHPEEWHNVVKPGRDVSDVNPAGQMQLTITFDMNGEEETEVALRIRFADSSLRDRFVEMGIHAAWAESFDSLAALLSVRA